VKRKSLQVLEVQNRPVSMRYSNGDYRCSFVFIFHGCNVLAILSLGCSVISIAFIIDRFIFFTYAILAGLHYTCRD
jgi:hypothetical protein